MQVKKNNFTRKEVLLPNEALDVLDKKAKAESRKLKNYLEKVLVDKSEELKLKESEKI